MEHVVIPRIQAYIDFIKKVLDEQAREDFFRLKKLTDKKKKLKEQAIRKKELGEGEKKEKDSMEGEQLNDIEQSALANYGEEEGNEDVIF